jgi:HlyD family secretion protein
LSILACEAIAHVPEPSSKIFRQEALERLSSPERLDQLMEVVSPKGWIGLLSLGLIVMTGLVWSVLGRLPVSVPANGVLVRPRKVVEIQATGSGRLAAWYVRVGDTVRPHDLIGRLDQPELQQQLRQQQTKLTELTAQDQLFHQLWEARLAQDRRTRELQRRSLLDRLTRAERLQPQLQDRYERRRRLGDKGGVPGDEVLAAYQLCADNLTLIASLRADLQDLDAKEANSRQQTGEVRQTRQNQRLDLQRGIAALELQLARSSELRASHGGRILETAAAVGQLVTPGTRLASIAGGDEQQDLIALLYVPVRDGKKLKPGLPVQVVPDTVKRERFGGMAGTIAAVSAFPATRPAALTLIGNPELVDALLKGPQIEVQVRLQPDAQTVSGYKWSFAKGPPLALTAGTTVTARATVEELAPITFMLTFLRETSGLY